MFGKKATEEKNTNDEADKMIETNRRMDAIAGEAAILMGGSLQRVDRHSPIDLAIQILILDELRQIKALLGEWE